MLKYEKDSPENCSHPEMGNSWFHDEGTDISNSQLSFLLGGVSYKNSSEDLFTLNFCIFNSIYQLQT